MLRCLFVLVLLFTSSVFAAENIEVSYGTAFNEKGEVVYREKHTSEFSQGQLKKLKTEYFNKEGGAFGSILSNFTKNSYVPSYQFIDQRHGRQAGISWLGDKVIAYAQKAKNSSRQEKSFTVNNKTVAGQGLHNFIRLHLDDFVNNSDFEKQISFLIPMNQDIYSFRVRSKAILSKEGVVKIRIEADNWFFRLIAPHIDVTYDISKRRLLEYKGPSNLVTETKEQMNVTISYAYPTAQARR